MFLIKCSAEGWSFLRDFWSRGVFLVSGQVCYFSSSNFSCWGLRGFSTGTISSFVGLFIFRANRLNRFNCFIKG